MKVRIGGGEREVETRLSADAGTLILTVDGTTHEVPFRRSGGSLQVCVDGRWSEAWSDGKAAAIGGRFRTIERVVAGGRPAGGSLASPMPAVVTAVRVTVGQRVEEGEVVALVSAMKTEIALRAPRAGLVTEVRVVTGQTVRAGEEVAVVRPEQ